MVKHCIIAENVTICENAVVGAMPSGDKDGVATVGAGLTIGENAVVGPDAIVKNDMKGGEEQW